MSSATLLLEGASSTHYRVQLLPAKTNLQDHARLCKNLACKTCLARASDMSLFLHDSCTILHQFLLDLAKNCANLQVIILAASLAKSCTISCKICARLCKNRARKGTYRVHVPSKSCMQDSCTILHDLASSFLQGCLHNSISKSYSTQ